jgi:Protein of unknown function (DUF1592)/Protein of unknown function (DUF1588)/Protein of unknown function (DUF1595)
MLMGGCYRGSEGAAADGDGSSSGATMDGSGDDSGSGDDATPAGCDDTPPRASLVRVNRVLYTNALESAFGVAAVDRVRDALDSLPSAGGGVFATELPPPSFSEVTAYVEIASRLAFELTRDETRLGELRLCLTDVPPGVDPRNDACVAGFVDELAPKLLRRPLDPDDRERFMSDYEVGGVQSVNEGIATLIVAMLNDPRFLYFLELDGEEIEPGVLELDDHELAARLARVLWDSVPDEELMLAADAGLDDEALAAQVDRMLNDERARVAFGRFFHDWLGLATLPYPSEDLFPDADEREALRDDMQAELLQFAQAVTFDQAGTYADLLLDRTAFVSSPELAQVYGIEVAPGGVELPAGERAGLLTRAGWLATIEIRASNAGHLIKRGAKLGRLICRPLPSPDPGNFPQTDPADPATNPTQGIRERFNAATEEAQCASCHALLDGYGAPFGHYGAAGQWIELEEIVAEDGSTVELPIDAAASVPIGPDGQTAVEDALALSQALADDPAGALCLSEQLVRNAVGRPVEADDACLTGTASDLLAPADGTPRAIREAVVAMLTSPYFRRVTIQ